MTKPDNIRRASVNSAFFFASRLIDMVAIVLLNVIVARHLGVTVYGQYSFIMAYVVSITMLSYFGLDTITMRDLSKHEDMAGEYLGSVIVARWMMSAIAAAIVLAGLPFIGLDAGLMPALIIMMASELAGSSVSVMSAVFRAKEQMRYEMNVTLAWRIVNLALVGLAAYRGMGINAICAAMLIANLFRLAVNNHIVKTRFVKPVFTHVRVLMKGIFKDAFLMGAAMLMTNWLFRSAQIAIKFLEGVEHVAYFQVSHAIVLQVSTVAMSIAMAVFPMISRRAIRDGAEAVRVAAIYGGVARLLLFLGLVLSAALTVLSRPIISLLFGADFMDAVPVFRMLLAAVVPIFLYTLHVLTFAAYNKQKFVILSRGFALLIVTLLYTVLIPYAGALGAAYAYLASSFVIVLIESGILKSRVIQDVKPPMGVFFLNQALALATSVCFMLEAGWIWKALVLAAVSVAALVQLKGLVYVIKGSRAAMAGGGAEAR